VSTSATGASSLIATPVSVQAFAIAWVIAPMPPIA
jgi:hypothetical protein